jgi:hypothetical protein
VENAVFPDSKVREAFRKFVVVSIWVDDPDDEVSAFNYALQERLISNAKLPAYVVIDPETEMVLGNWGFENRFVSDPSLFVERMEKALASFAAIKTAEGR